MAKATTKSNTKAPKNTTKTPPIADLITNDEETNSYDEQLNKRIDPKKPEGGTPPDETEEHEPTESENANSQGDPASDPEDNGETEEQLSDDVLEMLSNYVKAYPDNPIFWQTSDGQVFLDRNKNDAFNHEKTLGGKVKSYAV